MMFSSISSDYERNLKDELFGCFKYIGIPLNILDKMPIRDRKFYIAKHNGIVEVEKKKSEEKNGGSHVDGLFIDGFTDMSQGQAKKNNKG